MISGPMGILVPMVNSKTDAENAVKFCKYPPQGVRGMGSSHASIYGLKMQEYISAANKEIMVIIQNEHKDAVEAIDDILSVPGIDVAFIGPMDLSTSMGFLGEPNHPKVSKAIEKVKSSAKKNRVPLGIFSPTSDDVLRRLKEGFLFIGYGADSLFLTSQALKDMKIIREAL